MTGDEPAGGNFPQGHRLCADGLRQWAPAAQPASDEIVHRTGNFTHQREGIAFGVRIWNRAAELAPIILTRPSDPQALSRLTG